MSDHMLHEGKRVGSYRLLTLLGRGGFGDVYLGEQVHDHTQVAVKILHRRLTQSKDVKEFINEARMFRLQHPNIAPLLDFGVDHDDMPFLVMAYASHGNLRQRYERGAKLSPRLVAYYVSQIASALHYAHDRRIVHRDVKPENMLLSGDGRVMLTDFGVASVAHSSQSFSEDKNVGGTVHYMAPEQLRGRACPASDQYALAVVAYEWLCGQRPFEGNYLEVSIQHITMVPPPLCNRAPSLPSEIEDVVLKALVKDPDERFPTVQDFADALQQACQNLPFSATAARLMALPRLVPMDFATQPPDPSSSPPVADRVANMSATLAAESSLPTLVRNPSLPRMSLSRTLVIPTVLLLACVLLIGGISMPYVLSYLQVRDAQASDKTNVLASPADALHAIEARAPDYQDALTNAQNSVTEEANWSNNDGCIFTNNGYQVASARGRQFCHELGRSYSNYAVRITMAMNAGDATSSGALLFRDQDLDQVNGAYVFEIIANGYYKVSDVDKWRPLRYAASPAIHKGVRATNKLEVLARGSSLSFFVNDTFLFQINDTHYTHGPLSLAVFQGSAPSVSVYFSNLSIWKI